MRPRKRFSQHFLLNPAVVHAAVSTLKLNAGQNLLEVGPGKGMLTDELIKLNARFEAVEVDRDLCAHLRQRYNGEQGFKLTEGDILEMNWETAIFPGDMFTLVSNLPYHISSPFLLKVFEQRARIRRAILLLQKEFADRILGDHLKSKEEYGSLTVLFSLFFERHEIMTVEAEDFYPPPKVRSSLITLVPKPCRIINTDAFQKFVRGCFIYKRKIFAKSLAYALIQLGRPASDISCAESYLKRRPDDISPEEYAEIFEMLFSPISMPD